MDEQQSSLSLLLLPPEVIDQVLEYLSPYELADLSSTCRQLYAHTTNDALWQSFLQDNVQVALSSPSPSPTFRELYVQHHPRWFLTRHMIWFSDHQHSGKLIFARYDFRSGSIEAYTISAERGTHIRGTLDWDGQIEYHTFHPKFRLDLNSPVIHLALDLNPGRSLQYKNEIPMSGTSPSSRNHSTFLHTRALPENLIHPSSAVWPPQTLPAQGYQRTRNASSSEYRGAGHKPWTLSEMNDATFRIRQWVDYTHSIPLPLRALSRGPHAVDLVSTWATLPTECYTATKEKPWQGIWCGDYSGHGCEFLLITQPLEPKPLPEKARKAFALWPHTDLDLYGRPLAEDDSDDDSDNDEDDVDLVYDASADNAWVGNDVASTNASAARRFLRSRKMTTLQEPSPDDTAPYKGRLEAIKLTGDPNIPRGEITFIADDLGSRGLVSHATEPVFDEHYGEIDRETGEPRANTSPLRQGLKGARMVKAVGHIAGGGFRGDCYIPSQLILVSENRLALYWRPFGHVSFYERVDVEQFLRAP